MAFLHRGHFFARAGPNVPGYICHTHRDDQGRKIATSFAPKDHPCRLAIRHWHAHNSTRTAWQEYQYAMTQGKPSRGMTFEQMKATWERYLEQEKAALQELEAVKK